MSSPWWRATECENRIRLKFRSHPRKNFWCDRRWRRTADPKWSHDVSRNSRRSHVHSSVNYTRHRINCENFGETDVSSVWLIYEKRKAKIRYIGGTSELDILYPIHYSFEPILSSLTLKKTGAETRRIYHPVQALWSSWTGSRYTGALKVVPSSNCLPARQNTLSCMHLLVKSRA